VNVRLQAGRYLGVLRPYFVDIFVPSPVFHQFGQPVPQPYDPNVHDYVDIVGVSNLFNSGFGQIRLQPGLSFRALALVEFSPQTTSINALEIGANLDYFFSDVPIMAIVENRRVYLSMTLGVVFGATWRTEEIEK